MSFNSGFFIQQASVTPPTQYSMSFDGVNESIISSYSASHEIERTDLVSFSFWIKPTASQYGGIVSKYYGAGGGTTGWATYYTPTNKVAIDLIGNAGTNSRLFVESNNVASLNNWHHIVITYSGNSNVTGVKFYIDNVLSTNITILNGLNASIINALNSVTFGIGQNNLYFAGNMYDVRVWKGVVLTPLEVTDLYDNGTDLYPLNLIIRNACGADALFGTNTWILPDLTAIVTGFQSVNMELADRTIDIP